MYVLNKPYIHSIIEHLPYGLSQDIPPRALQNIKGFAIHIRMCIDGSGQPPTSREDLHGHDSRLRRDSAQDLFDFYSSAGWRKASELGSGKSDLLKELNVSENLFGR